MRIQKKSKMISYVLLLVFLLTMPINAAEGFSDTIESNDRVTDMPDNTVKGLFSPEVEGAKPRTNVVTPFTKDTDSNGVADGWITVYSSNETLSDGVQSFLPTAKYGRVQSDKVPAKPDDIYYIRASVETESETCIFYLRFFTSSNVLITARNVPVTGASSLKTFSAIKSSSDSNIASIDTIVQENADSGFQTIKVKEVLVENLTERFGAGNEPDVAWCDENLRYVEDTATCALNYELVSRSKNLLNKDEAIDNSLIGKNTKKITDVSHDPQWTVSQPIWVQEGQVLHSNIARGTAFFSDHNWEHLNLSTGETFYATGETITIPEGVNGWVQFNINKGSTDDLVNLNIQIEVDRGQTLEVYEPYQIPSKTEFSVPSEYPLIEVPNGVKNYIGDNGSYYINVKKILINESNMAFSFAPLTNVDGFVMAINEKTSPYTENIILESFTRGTFLDDVSAIGTYYTNPGNIVLIVAKGTSLADAKNLVLGKELIYGTNEQMIIANGTNSYSAPTSLQCWENGDLVINPISSETSVYDNGIVVVKQSMPIDSLKEVYRLEAGTKYPVDLDKVSVSSDGLSLTIDGATTGEIYTYSYEYPEELFVYPTIKFSVPINQQGQIESSIEVLGQQEKKIDFIIQQLEMIQQELDDINNMLQ